MCICNLVEAWVNELWLYCGENFTTQIISLVQVFSMCTVYNIFLTYAVFFVYVVVGSIINSKKKKEQF